MDGATEASAPPPPPEPIVASRRLLTHRRMHQHPRRDARVSRHGLNEPQQRLCQSHPLAYIPLMEFECDEVKSNACFAQRGFDFAYAVRVFLDPLRLVEVDERFDYGEIRYRVLGQIEGREFVVVYATRGSALRIISARMANRKEVARYAEGKIQA